MPVRGIAGKSAGPGDIQSVVAMVDLDDGLGDRFGRRFRQHHATCTGLYRLGNGDGFVQSLEHQHFHLRVAGESGDDLQRVQRIWKEAEKNDVGTQLIGKIQRLGIVAGLAAHFHPGLPGIDQVMQAHENEGTTIDQHHAYGTYASRHELSRSPAK
ncbi:hypothetical protein D9M69_530890 [compost metagenome]